MVILILLFSFIAFANENPYKGTVIVLEAPLFLSPNSNEKVIQWARKGDLLQIHPHHFNYIGKENEQIDIGTIEDPLFKNDKQRDFDHDFYLILAKNGQEAYIQKNFVHLNYNDPRELSRKDNAIDITDYRIAEPLPANYPIKIETGYRGSFSLGLGKVSDSSYNYSEKIKKSDSSLYKSINLTWAKRSLLGTEDAIFYGGIVSINSYSSSTVHENYDANESEFSFAIGPRVAYDIITYNDSFFSLALGIPISLIKNLTVEIETPTGKNKRVFKSFTISPQLDLTYTKSKAFRNLDFITGVNAHLDLLNTYTLMTDESDQDSVWTDNEFNKNRNLQLSYFIGLQSNY